MSSMYNMIPVSIDATLQADLEYNPSMHVQTVEIDRKGTSMLPIATNEFVKWYISKNDFLNMCEINPNGSDVSNNIYTMNAGTGRSMPEASDAILNFNSLAQTYTINLIDPTIVNGTVSSPAKIGNMDICYNRVFKASDGSSNTTVGATSTGWSFSQSSLDLTLRWQTDASGRLRVTADPNANITVSKPMNDAAADFIQIGMSGDILPPHGRTSSSADVNTAVIDYGDRFELETADHIQTIIGEPTVTIDDVVFTKALQQAINADGIVREVSNNASLRSAVSDAVDQGYLQGLQSPSPLIASFQVTLAGERRYPDDVSHNLTPLIVIQT